MDWIGLEWIRGGECEGGQPGGVSKARRSATHWGRITTWFGWFWSVVPCACLSCCLYLQFCVASCALHLARQCVRLSVDTHRCVCARLFVLPCLDLAPAPSSHVVTHMNFLCHRLLRTRFHTHSRVHESKPRWKEPCLSKGSGLFSLFLHFAWHGQHAVLPRKTQHTFSWFMGPQYCFLGFCLTSVMRSCACMLQLVVQQLFASSPL